MNAGVGSERYFGAQLVSFVVVGLLTNGALYALYLALTFAGLTPLASMSVAYVVGVALSFTLNGRITFAGRSSDTPTFFRYVAAYALGYVFNATGLWLAAAVMGMPHYWAQLIMIGATAALLFILQRWWVFRARSAVPVAASHYRT